MVSIFFFQTVLNFKLGSIYCQIVTNDFSVEKCFFFAISLYHLRKTTPIYRAHQKNKVKNTHSLASTIIVFQILQKLKHDGTMIVWYDKE